MSALAVAAGVWVCVFAVILLWNHCADTSGDVLDHTPVVREIDAASFHRIEDAR